MNVQQLLIRWKTVTARILLVTVLFSIGPAASADEPGTTGYQSGDIVRGFSTVLRSEWLNEDLGQMIPAGTTLRLEDFTGKILFIEFYDPYCSICREGIRLTTSEIRDYYEEREGNVHGVPVVYLAINLESAEYAQEEADRLLNEYYVSLRGNDYVPERSDIAVNLFSTHNAKPVFVAINCVPNSPDHEQYELLVNKSSVVESQIPSLIPLWKSAIDSVKAPPPSIENAQILGEGTLEFSLQGRLNSTYRVASTTNFVDWDFGAKITGTNGPIVFRYSTAISPQRFFRIVSP